VSLWEWFRPAPRAWYALLIVSPRGAIWSGPQRLTDNGAQQWQANGVGDNWDSVVSLYRHDGANWVVAS
jgi:hypothetical protein